MRINVFAVASIDSKRLIYQNEVAVLARPIAGKKTQVTIEPSATVGDLVAAASTNFSFPESLGICRAYLVMKDTPINNDFLLSDLNLLEESNVSIRFVIEVY
jgi:hypothetical protein